MTRLAWFAVVMSGACSFSSHTLPPDTTPDAAEPPDAVVDGPLKPDAAAPDAAGMDAGVDGPPDPCLGGSVALELATDEEGNLSGPDRYDPTCSGGDATGPADIYFVDITAINFPDLVVEVEPKAGGLDAIIDVTQSCLGGGVSAGACKDTAGPGRAEVVVLPTLLPGRRYIAVDSLGSTQGQYVVRAFTRAVVSTNATCTPDLQTSRCPVGIFCLDLNDDGVAKCEDIGSEVKNDLGANDDCNTGTVMTTDGAFTGNISGISDSDVVRLDPAGSPALRAFVMDEVGGCSVDVKLELLSGADCGSSATAKTDDDSGIGPCPFLEVTQLPANVEHWLKVSPQAGAHIASGANYTLVVDFIKP